MTNPNAEYVPFGPEWEAEVSKSTKAEIIAMLSKALREKAQLEAAYAMIADALKAVR